jgi:hypothetical protein
MNELAETNKKIVQLKGDIGGIDAKANASQKRTELIHQEVKSSRVRILVRCYKPTALTLRL